MFKSAKVKMPSPKYVGYRYSNSGGYHHNIGWADDSLQFSFNEALSMYWHSMEVRGQIYKGLR